MSVAQKCSENSISSELVFLRIAAQLHDSLSLTPDNYLASQNWFPHSIAIKIKRDSAYDLRRPGA